MEECIFCKIVNHEIPNYTVYEDDTYLAFLDIFPRVKGHALVIPKKHYRWVYDVENFSEFWDVARKVSMNVQKTLNAKFVSYITMGEAVHHAHIHILPQDGEDIKGIKFTEVIKMEKEEIAELAQSLKKE